MSDAIKWALLGAALVIIIGMIVALPFNSFIDTSQFSSALNSVVSVCQSGFTFARGLINNFLSPFGRTVLTGLLAWLLGKKFILVSIKIVSSVYHFIFK